MIGALREILPVPDVVQEKLFDDSLVILAHRKDDLTSGPPPSLQALRERPWLVQRRGTPARDQFEAMFEQAAVPLPESIIETGSVILMREMVQNNGYLACISQTQAAQEIERGIVAQLPFPGSIRDRSIGLTLRKDWHPTPAQGEMLDAIRDLSQYGNASRSPTDVA